MRTFRSFILVLAVLSFASCKNKDKAPKTTGEQIPTDNSQVVSTDVRLQVSFYSIGAGIDSENNEKFESWLKDRTKKVKYSMERWGREGEVNYCFTLSELNPKEQEKFVADTKTFLSKCTLVHINENVPCTGKK